MSTDHVSDELSARCALTLGASSLGAVDTALVRDGERFVARVTLSSQTTCEAGDTEPHRAVRAALLIARGGL